MRAFLLWLLVPALGFGGYALVAHGVFSASPSRVLVVVDASLAMADAWPRVPAVLDRLDDAPYAVFALRTQRAPIHGWDAELDLGRMRAFGGRDFERLAALDADGADRRVLITNAGVAELAALDEWEIVRP